MRKIVTAGSILVDRINEVGAYPHAGELVQIRSVARVPGGLVPNVGRDLRILAPEIPAAAAGLVGDDDDGRYVRAELAASGLDVTDVAVSSTSPTSFTNVVSVPDGERTFFTYPGASAQWGYDEFPFGNVSPGDIVLLGYFLLLAKVDAGDGVRILRELKARGVTTAIDLVTEDSTRYGLVRDCLPFVDNLIVNETEATRLVGDGAEGLALLDCAQRLLDLGVRERVVIHAPQGAVSLTKAGTRTERPAITLPSGFIKGKTGAGDAFCAGALVGIYRNLSEAEILDLGALAAVGALSAPGACDGMRSFVVLKSLVQTFPNSM